MDYRDAGVDRDGASGLVESLRERVKKTYRPEILSEIGDFGGFFQAPKSMKDPIFVATTDGVGTKLLLAEAWTEKTGNSKCHRGIGQDAVAMCVNDLLACRAEPLVFLDYLATGKLGSHVLENLLEGIIQACADSGCSLIGGETAQMPGFYANHRYDVAGFSLGVLERDQRLSPKNVMPGDLVYGIPSSGFHSNGFSLIRKVMEDEHWKLEDIVEGRALAEHLLEPTRLVKPSPAPTLTIAPTMAPVKPPPTAALAKAPAAATTRGTAEGMLLNPKQSISFKIR